MYKCKHCGKEFDNKFKLAGHSTFCTNNPNRKQNLKKLAEARKSIEHNIEHQHLHCQYCNKEVANKGCLVRHENSCKFNPKSEKFKYINEKQIKETKTKQKKVISEETKQKIREGLQRWKENNKEKFIAYSKGQSQVCENFKQYLRNNNIDFVEEYCPYPEERLYRLDISWPDEKIAVEINGSQHYDSEGNLNEISLEKQKFFEDKGWKIIQIYYRWCYSIIKNQDKINSIFDLPIHNKNYVKECYKRSYISKLKKEKLVQEREEKINARKNKEKQIIQNLIENSGIDFSKSGWSTEAKQYLENRGELWSKHVFQNIKKYFPEFLQRNDVWKRKGSKY